MFKHNISHSHIEDSNIGYANVLCRRSDWIMIIRINISNEKHEKLKTHA